MTPFRSLHEYETFVYTLPQQFPNILRSTLIVARRGRLLAELSGELAFVSGHRLVVYERLSFAAPNLPFLIQEIESTVLNA
jgi:hypothetical protein